MAETSWPDMTFRTGPGVPVPGGLPPEEGFVRSRRGDWLGADSILAKYAPSMSEQACQKPFLAYLKVKSYVVYRLNPVKSPHILIRAARYPGLQRCGAGRAANDEERGR